MTGGNYNENSNIDILVDFKDHIGIGFIKLAHELEDMFRRKFDLLSCKGIKSSYLPYGEKNLIHV